MRLSALLSESLSDFEITLPVGKKLYHGSGEGFPEENLTVGAYDEILWTTEYPVIAQTYIPRQGGSMYVSIRAIQRPSQDRDVRKVQEMIGIVYDLDKVEWDKNGDLKSWPHPNGWNKMPSPEKVYERMGRVGFKPYMERSWGPDEYTTYEIRLSGGKILKGNAKLQGRLFILVAEEPLRIFDMTEGGEREGDINNVMYHQHGAFKKIRQLGFDGVKIVDFAQVHNHGNVEHTSIGIFKHAIPKLSWKTIPATHPDIDNDFHKSPEVEANKELFEGLITEEFFKDGSGICPECYRPLYASKIMENPNHIYNPGQFFSCSCGKAALWCNSIRDVSEFIKALKGLPNRDPGICFDRYCGHCLQPAEVIKNGATLPYHATRYDVIGCKGCHNLVYTLGLSYTNKDYIMDWYAERLDQLEGFRL